MILLIDAGNSRAKLSWLLPGAQARTQPAIPLEYRQAATLARRLAHRPRRILGVQVTRAAARQALEQACWQAWGLAIEWLDTRTGRDHLHNAYDAPEQLGADRWLAMLGLLQHVRARPAWQAGSPCLLASFGTATTIDTLAPPGSGHDQTQAAFLGGLILPGSTLMANSLARGTDRLPDARGAVARRLPTDTHSAIISGIVAAQAGALHYQWQQMRRQWPRHAPQVFVSGGHWPLVEAAVRNCLDPAQPHDDRPGAPVQWLESPVLDGLAWAARQTAPCVPPAGPASA